MCSVTERLAGVVRVGAKPASRLAGRCGGGKPAWNRCRGTGAKWFHPLLFKCSKCREMTHKSRVIRAFPFLVCAENCEVTINAATLRGPRCAHRREP